MNPFGGLRFQPTEMLEVVADRDVLLLNLKLLPPQPLIDMSDRRKKKIIFIFT